MLPYHIHHKKGFFLTCNKNSSVLHSECKKLASTINAGKQLFLPLAAFVPKGFVVRIPFNYWDFSIVYIPARVFQITYPLRPFETNKVFYVLIK